MNIYVGNLPYSVNDQELEDTFAQYGAVSSAKVITDKMSGRSKGFGFVDMPEDSDANAAIDALNGQPLKGRNLKVNQAKPRREHSSRPAYNRDNY